MTSVPANKPPTLSFWETIFGTGKTTTKSPTANLSGAMPPVAQGTPPAPVSPVAGGRRKNRARTHKKKAKKSRRRH